MRRKAKKRRFGKPKARLGLPDLDQSKAAVIGSLRSPESQRGYPHPINEFTRAGTPVRLADEIAKQSAPENLAGSRSIVSPI
jgi:hypothetical protein